MYVTFFMCECFFEIFKCLLCSFLPHDLYLSLFLQMDGGRDEGSSNKTTRLKVRQTCKTSTSLSCV